MPKQKRSNNECRRPHTRQYNKLNSVFRAKLEVMRRALASKCRFCMKEGNLGIFDDVPITPGEAGLVEKIKSVLSLDVLAERTETTPDKICSNCLNMITTLYEFKLRAHYVQNILKRQINGKNCRPG